MAIQQMTSPLPSAVAAGGGQRFLIGPIADFLCLGGLTFLLLPPLLLLPAADYQPPLAALMMLVAHVINHPHFAHSYQIFYGNFRMKAFSREYDRVLRARYNFAGLAATLMLGLFFAICVAAGDARTLGYAANFMLFLVGWHYVKQGYGMLMVDAVLKRQFFKPAEKKIFLINAYTVWILAWVNLNTAVREHQFWNLHYYTLAVPSWLFYAATAIALATSGLCLWALVIRWRTNGNRLPYNGVIAYFVSLYPWTLFMTVDPLCIFVIPALHSLQYLAVVWRYKLNEEKDRAAASERPRSPVLKRLFPENCRLGVARFVVAGTVLGFLGFWALPIMLQLAVPYDREAFGATLFLFICWIFINVHHYFIDNVMWRRENPDTKRYLFC